MLHLITVGLSHHTAPLVLREQFSFENTRLDAILLALMRAGAREAVVLSTCNRTEVTVRGLTEGELTRLLSEQTDIAMSVFTPHLYIYKAQDAIEHLLRVSAGLESLVLGEHEILGQVRRAWESARKIGCTGKLLDALFRSALTLGKNVRSNTELGQHAVSIGSLALRKAMDEFPDFWQRTILVVGAGKMGQRLLNELVDRRNEAGTNTVITLLTRNPKLAKMKSDFPNVRLLETGKLYDLLPNADIIFTCTESLTPLLDCSTLLPLTAKRKGRPMLMVDLGVPRNISPCVRKAEFARLFDLEDLNSLSEAHTAARAGAIPSAERMLEEHMVQFLERWRIRDNTEMIKSLKAYVESIRVQQLDWALPKLGELTDKQTQVVEQLTRRIVQQMMHQPLHSLNSIADNTADLEAFVRIFGLEKEADA